MYDKYVKQPRWIVISELPCANVNFFLKDEKSGIMGMGKQLDDGSYKWGWPAYVPTHYWSF